MKEQLKCVLALHGAPRSGTSWLGQLLNSSEHVAYRYQPFFSHAFRGHVTRSSSHAAIKTFITDLLASEDEFLLQKGHKQLAASTPEFQKAEITHLVYKEVRFHHLLPTLMDALPDLKVIGLVRDPRSVLSSWAMAPREFDSAWSLEDEWRKAPSKNAGLEENWYGFERWVQLTGLFLRLQRHWPNRFHVLRYEDLVADPFGVTEFLFHFAGLPFSTQTAAFITASTSSDDGEPYGVFRRHGQPPTKCLPDNIARQIEQGLRDTEYEQFLSSTQKAQPMNG